MQNGGLAHGHITFTVNWVSERRSKSTSYCPLYLRMKCIAIGLRFEEASKPVCEVRRLRYKARLKAMHG